MKKLTILLLFAPLLFSCSGKEEKTNTNGSDMQNAPANNTPVTAQPESTVSGAVHFDTVKQKKDTLRKP